LYDRHTKWGHTSLFNWLSWLMQLHTYALQQCMMSYFCYMTVIQIILQKVCQSYVLGMIIIQQKYDIIHFWYDNHTTKVRHHTFLVWWSYDVILQSWVWSRFIDVASSKAGSLSVVDCCWGLALFCIDHHWVSNLIVFEKEERQQRLVLWIIVQVICIFSCNRN
jgi:hypothetical protein